MGQEIISLVNTEAIERNRYYFSILIDIVALLAAHQLAFREKLTHIKAKTKKEMDNF